MKTKNWRKRLAVRLYALMGALLLLVSPALAGNFAWFTDIVVTPVQPSDIDPVTLDISGGASSSPSYIVSSVLQQNHDHLILDLTVDMGILGALSWWAYSEQIGTFTPGDYVVTVNVFYPRAFPGEELQDTQVIGFGVIPEPGTVVSFGLGVPFLRVLLRRGAKKIA